MDNGNMNNGQGEEYGGQTGMFTGNGQEPSQNYGNDNQEQSQGYGYENQGQPQGYGYDNQGQPAVYPNANQNYQYSQQGGYQQELEEPVSVGEWVISLLLIMFVPCVNIVLMFVWAFSKSEKKSKSNFFKAQLIISGVLLALYLIIIVAVIFFAAATAW